MLCRRARPCHRVHAGRLPMLYRRVRSCHRVRTRGRLTLRRCIRSCHRVHASRLPILYRRIRPCHRVRTRGRLTLRRCIRSSHRVHVHARGLLALCRQIGSCVGRRAKLASILYGSDMALIHRQSFACGGTRDHTAPTIETRTIGRRGHVPPDRGVRVHVAHHRAIHVHHRCVVTEGTPGPNPAIKTMAWIAEPVINSAIESDMGTPVTRMPDVNTAEESPVARSPQQTNLGWRYPRARDPVIPCRPPSPIPGV